MAGDLTGYKDEMRETVRSSAGLLYGTLVTGIEATPLITIHALCINITYQIIS
jgi:hypothetical protein